MLFTPFRSYHWRTVLPPGAIKAQQRNTTISFWISIALLVLANENRQVSTLELLMLCSRFTTQSDFY